MRNDDDLDRLAVKIQASSEEALCGNCKAKCPKTKTRWRGYRARKYLSDVYSWYEDVVGTIDGSTNIHPTLFPNASTTFKLRRPEQLCCSWQSTTAYSQNKPVVTSEPAEQISIEDVYAEDSFITSSTAPDVDAQSTCSDNIPRREEGASSLEDTSETNDSSHSYDSSEYLSAKQQLLDAKKDITLELFWVQQAIESRRNYLQIKHDLATPR